MEDLVYKLKALGPWSALPSAQRLCADLCTREASSASDAVSWDRGTEVCTVNGADMDTLSQALWEPARIHSFLGSLKLMETLCRGSLEALL